MFAAYCRLNLHVGQSWRDVVRATSATIKPRHRFARSVRSARHKWFRMMLDEHLDAQELYRVAMGGWA